MSELKVYKISGIEFDSRFYHKSEADKVIAELKDKCQMHDFFWEGCGFAKRGFKNSIAVSEAYDFLEDENKQLKESIAAYQRNEKISIWDTRHQKYKRCLEMCRYCAIKALYELDCKGDDVKWKLYSKWMHKWYNLAKKFKEAK